MTQKTVLFFFVMSLFLSACRAAPAASPTPQAVSSTISVVQKTAAAPTSVSYPAPQAEMATQPGLYPAPPNETPSDMLAQQTLIPPTLDPQAIKPPKPGSATLHGVLLVTDPLQGRPKTNDAIFLVPLTGDGVMSIPPFKVGEVPQAEVNEITGEFTFTDIMPGLYAVVVLTAGEAQLPARYFKDKNLAIITVKDSDIGQTIELEYLYI